MTGEEFADRLERFSRGMDALQDKLKKVTAERDALQQQVTALTLRLQSHQETQQMVNAERNLLRSEGFSLREEISRLRVQLRGVRNPTYPAR